MRIEYKELEETLFIEKELELYSHKTLSLLKKLSNIAFPNYIFGKYDKRWINFYFPCYLDEKIIIIPFALILYKNNYYLYFSGINQECRYFYTNIKIDKNSKENNLVDLINRIIENSIIIFKSLNKEKLEKMVPIRFREGEIKRKFVYKPYLSKEEAKIIENAYLKNLKTTSGKREISLKEYLDVASIAIRSIYNDDETPEQLYKKYSDFRRGDILEIDKNNSSAFLEWDKKNRDTGLHSYEIITGYLREGIKLFPPFYSSNNRYILSSSEEYYPFLIRIVKTFINLKIPFEFDYKKVLKYLTGEDYIEVNSGDYNSIVICEEEDPLAKKVKWKELKLPKPKSLS